MEPSVGSMRRRKEKNKMALIVAAASSSRVFLSAIAQNYSRIAPNFLAITRKNHNEATSYDGNYDIVITGGGMVGTTLAVALANNRKLEVTKILLLEGGNRQDYKIQEKYSNRVVALNQQTRTLLSSISAWKHIQDASCTPVRKMQVWDACSDAMITFNEDHLAEEMAYIVENDLLLHAVNQRLPYHPSIRVVYNARVEDVALPRMQGEDARVALQNGQEYRTKLLVGADGANSRVRQAMGVQYLKWDYDQMGIVATVQLSEPTDNVVAWQRFLPTGPVTLLPLTDTLSSLVWSVTTARAKELLKLSEEDFVDCLNEALWKVYPKDGIVESGMKTVQQLLEGLSLQTGVARQLQPSVSHIVDGSRAAFPLGFGHSTCYVKPGAVLVGDAAHRVHPLAGQGVNLGFGDVAMLVKSLAEGAANGAVFGDMTYLSRYQTLRQRHNVPTMLAIDALHRLYKGTAAPIVLARSLGLQLTNAIAPLKMALMQHASDQSSVR